MKVTQLELRDQVGQLFIMGFDGLALDDRLRSLLNRLQPAGVILFARNIESPRQVHALLTECRRTTPVPMFTCVDLEGGTVDRLKNVIAPAPSQWLVGSTRSRRLFREFGRMLGDEARTLGFNVDFAPVSDLGFEASRSVLGSRTISADPQEATAFVGEFLKGLTGAGVLGCGKHFPGLGEGNLDTHMEMANINKPWNRLWAEDLMPYRKLGQQFPFVMVAHAAYPQVSGEKEPASLSRKWMTDILRRKIGYKGIVICDDLEMGGVLAAASMPEAAVETIRSGADIYLVCRKVDEVEACYTAVLRQAEKEKKFAARVRDASSRVLDWKRRWARLLKAQTAPSEKDISRLKRRMEAFRQTVSKAAKER